jgi:hypothetical protein
MLALELFTWWYGQGWAAAAQNTRKMLMSILHAFSVLILLRTLFAPWRRIITYPGASLEAKLHAFGDNIVSRAIGFVVRLIVLLTAFLMSAVALITGIAGVILWPLVPPGALLLLIKGLVG